MIERRCVILESPYRGHGESEGEIRSRTQWNVDYARLCVRDSVLRGEAPIASHLLYTQPTILRDDLPEERAIGIECGLAWLPKSSYSVFYTDHGWSTGMLAALHNHNLGRNYSLRLRSLKGRNSVQLPATLHDEIETLLRHYIED